jgi:predicted ATPase
MQLEHIEFAPITIFYGNNGCGKSTLLNVIAERIGIKNKTQGNSNEYFENYVKKCTYSSSDKMPEDSVFIRSEDIMAEITKRRARFARMKEELLKDDSLKDYGVSQKLYRQALIAPDEVAPDKYAKLSRLSDFASTRSCLASSSADFVSNGEKALEFFRDHLFEDTLYLLDEPENSMAPAYQMELAHEIALLAYRLNSQFIIATHSPFMLSIEGARIYDLDARPARVREWYELENMQTYYQLFKKNADKFEENKLI